MKVRNKLLRVTLALLFAVFTPFYLHAEIKSGSCGDNVTFTLDTETGVLRIEGSGAMEDYDYYTNRNHALWYESRNVITEVEIAEGVTSIGNYAFFNCNALTSVTIPSSVTKIGNWAFADCTSLPVEDNIRYADTYLVEAVDKNLETYTIKDGTRFLGNEAFDVCSSLTSIVIPEGVISIGEDAFSGCYSLSSITIPESVTSIEQGAFAGIRLPKKDFTNNSSLIDNGYHWGATIADIELDNGLLVTDDVAVGCRTWVNSVTIPEYITSISSNAFSYCNALTSVTIPESVTSIGGNAFEGCKSLTSVNIPNGVTSIEKYTFSGCKSLTSVTIPNSVTSIEQCTFFGCNNLTSVIIPNSVTSIEQFTFYKCSALTSVTIPESVTSIGPSAFNRCSALTSVTIPEGVTSIGSNAFDGCTSLSDVIILATTPPTIKNNSFTTYGTLYVIPGCKTTYEATNVWSNFTVVNNANFETGSCGPNVTYTLNKETGVLRIEGGGAMKNYYDLNDLMNCYDYEVPWKEFLTIIKEVIIRSGVTSIGDYAFEGCSNLTSVTISSSVTSIGNGAFIGCSGLTSVTIPSSITSIGESTFEGCSSLTSITIPASVTNLGDRAFAECNNLSSITLPSSITSIEHGVFVDCNNLTSITIPSSVTSIGGAAFLGCSGLTSVTIPSSVTSIGRYAFSDCSGLTSVTIPSTVTNIDMGTFEGCSGLTSVTMPSSVTIIEPSTFEGCRNLTSVNISSSVTIIRFDAFLDCNSLTSIIIPSSVTSIEEHAFSGCTSLTNIIILRSTPPTVSGDSFSTYGTLHVRPGCKVAYETADVWKNFRIVEDAYDFFVLTDAESYVNNGVYDEVTITYKRTFNDTNWQPLFIPFAPSYDDWSENFEIARLNAFYEYDEQGESKKKIEFIVIKDADAVLKPNHPYLIRAKEVGEKTIKTEHTTLYTTDANTFDDLSCSTVENNFEIKGTYSNNESILGKYYVADGKFWLDETGYNSLPYRWFISSESKGAQYNHAAAEVRARSIDISVIGSDEASSIIDIESEPTINNNVKYSLDGRIISGEPAKGAMFIMNGRKYINR